MVLKDFLWKNNFTVPLALAYQATDNHSLQCLIEDKQNTRFDVNEQNLHASTSQHWRLNLYTYLLVSLIWLLQILMIADRMKIGNTDTGIRSEKRKGWSIYRHKILPVGITNHLLSKFTFDFKSKYSIVVISDLPPILVPQTERCSPTYPSCRGYM